MMEIDCRGLSCPIPVLNVKKALMENPGGVDVIGDDRAARENIGRLVANQGYKIEIEEGPDGIWKMKIAK